MSRARHEPAFEIGRGSYIEVSDHMEKRMRQRGIGRDAIFACLVYGNRTHAGSGRIRVMLRRQDVPEGTGHENGKFVGLVCIVEDVDGTPRLITAYRRRRPKHNRWNFGRKR